ncbi:MAG: 16S rRNA (adenine(1518)-N(6)/adenine(1519)-N(6))-dimethyltransferase RsmA [Opitutaceae bacterium]|jgi:16S rRNA (adenine1518-N6/adenine1519-N6)-dimethyltransferase|nr:16S rRNA (adenine(1518)-N(6)/adenine(1519)-N(6))-dimethyltransferase RsmA [Opitutaceae bacterium]
MPLSPSDTRELLARLGHSPRRFLGQNFLVDANIVRKSVELAEVSPGDAVVEIGPGLGTLSEALLEAGAELWAVEKDPRLAAFLREHLQPRFPGKFHLMEGDAVEFPLAGLPPRQAAAGFKIVANLPYAISTPWLDGVLSGPAPSRMALMLQAEAARRYTAPHGTKLFGAISIFLQAAFESAESRRVPAACFHPRPDVDSLLLHLKRRAEPRFFPEPRKKLVRACFQQRRKQLAPLLGKLLPDGGADWLRRLVAAGLPATCRAEEVPVSLWLELAADNGSAPLTSPDAPPPSPPR